MGTTSIINIVIKPHSVIKDDKSSNLIYINVIDIYHCKKKSIASLNKSAKWFYDLKDQSISFLLYTYTVPICPLFVWWLDRFFTGKFESWRNIEFMARNWSWTDYPWLRRGKQLAIAAKKDCECSEFWRVAFYKWSSTTHSKAFF